MVGFKTLSHKNSEQLLNARLPRSKIKTVTIDEQENKICNPFTYYTDNGLVVVTTPVPAGDFEALIESINLKEAQKSQTDASKNQPSFLTTRHLLVGLVGPGLTEQHIVTVHRPPDRDPNGKIQIFDSKTSDVKKFFNQKFAALPLVRGLFRSLIPSYAKHEVKLSDNLTGNYISLGTQSLFDGVSCGYHSAATMLAAKDLIDQNKDVTRENLLAKLRDPVGEAISNLPEEKVDSNFTSFIKKAWQDTYMPEAAEKNQPGFRHYFMGWPQEKGIGHKIVYFAGLGFIIHPLKNLVKLPSEFLFNALSESASYLKNRLIAWAPKNAAAQYLRSGLLLTATGFQGLFKGISIALRTVTSPITSYKAAAKIHPALGVLSAVVSAVAYAGLAVLVAPLALAAVAGFIPATQAALTPVISGLSFLPSALTPVIYAASAALIGGALAGISNAVDAVISRFSSTAEEKVVSNADDNLDANFVEVEPDVSPSLRTLGGKRTPDQSKTQDITSKESSSHDLNDESKFSSKAEKKDFKKAPENDLDEDSADDGFELVP